MEARIGFLKGMRQDFNRNLVPEDTYYEALNKQIVNDNESITGAVVDEPGNKLITGTLNLGIDNLIIKTISIRDWIISFVKDTTTPITYKIIKYKITNGAISNLSTVYSHDSAFFGNNIDCVVRYRDENLCKLYWTDGVNQLRHINIFADNSLLDISLLDITPTVNIYQPIVTDVKTGGRLKTGVYQYAYQLFNKNGAETTFSQLSPKVNISSGSLLLSKEFSGGEKEEVSNKSCVISFSNIDTKFEYLRVVSVYYADDLQEPEISVISEHKLNGASSLTIQDSGASIMYSISSEELNFIGGRTIIPTTITTKDNYLIAGNIKEEYFDIDEVLGTYWDARAYRFIQYTTTAAVDTTDDVATLVNDTFSNIPETHDAIQTKLEQTEFYNRQKNSSIFGGTGKNISYKFKVKTVPIDLLGDSDPSQFSIDSNAIEDTPRWNSETYAGYMRDEMYRFGIVFEKDGKYSFVKWIGDIKFPKHSDSDGAIVYYNDQITKSAGATDYKPFFKCTEGSGFYANILGIEFTVNAPSGYNWFIVRSPRTDKDKTILTQGVLGTVGFISQDDYLANHKLSPGFFSTVGSASYVKNNKLSDYFNSVKSLVYMNSPEINYNTIDISRQSGDYITLNQTFKLKTVTYKQKIDPKGDNNDANTAAINISKVIELATDQVYNDTTSEDFIYVTDAFKVGPSNAAFIENRSGLSNFINLALSTKPKGNGETSIGNTSLIISLNDDMGSSSNFIDTDDYGYVAVANYERPSNGIYGGNSYINKLATTYVKVSNVATTSGAIEVYAGDTYLQFFEYLDLSYNPKKRFDRFTLSQTMYVPLETTINLDFTHGFLRNKSFTSRQLAILQETQIDGQRLFPSGFSVDGVETEISAGYYNFYNDVYKYNNVFSRESQARIYTPKPNNFESLNTIDTRIISSELNSSNLVDNWTKFLYSSYQDLNTEYGKINKLIVFDNKLLAFQDRGIVVVGFNDREIQQNSGASPLTLGVGDRLTYHQYLTTYSGCINPNSIIDTGRALYYFDQYNKSLFRLTSKLEDLSNEKGVGRLFNNINYTTLSNILCGYDPINLRLYITFNGSTSTTLSFNEKLDAFESKHSYYPIVYFNHLGKLYEIKDNDLYLHGEGKILEFFGSASEVESYISFIVNAKPVNKVVFTNLEFNTNLYDFANNVFVDSSISTIPLSSIITETSYQSITHTTTIPNLRRRFRTWRYIIPKDSSGGRMNDYSCKITLKNNITQSPASYKSLSISNVIVYYLIPYI